MMQAVEYVVVTMEQQLPQLFRIFGMQFISGNPEWRGFFTGGEGRNSAIGLAVWHCVKDGETDRRMDGQNWTTNIASSIPDKKAKLSLG